MPGFPFTLRQLEVFSSLCATKSFRISAERLGISQASVSNQIKTLENQLGVSLFARRPGQRPILTPEGVDFADDLEAFNAAGKALARHRRSSPGEQGPVRFKILVGQGLADYYIRPKLDRFFATNPLIELDFESRTPSPKLAHDIEQSEFDFALVHQRADRPVDPTLRSLAQVRGGIYGHRDFAKGRKLPLSIEELSELPFVLPNAGSAAERTTMEALDQYDIRPRKVVGHSQYFDVIAAMLERGLGVASFADAIMSPDLRKTVVMLFPLDDWRLLWFRRDQARDERADLVESFILSAVLQDPNYPVISIDDETQRRRREQSAAR